MTDRELLEFAAKAAGIDITPYYWSDSGFVWIYEPSNDGSPAKFSTWNPLADDGNALRLEVDCNLTEKHEFLEMLHEENDKCDGDYRNARRRAIVRAAAEIGRRMP